MGFKAGLIGTIENCINQEATPAKLTTPDPIALNKLLYEMAEAGCQYVFMEASSHAIDQDRIAGLHIAGALFTNLTRDHIDYHKTMDAYIAAKKKLFDSLPQESFALVNQVSKPSSKHRAPEDCCDTAVHEHFNHLLGHAL